MARRNNMKYTSPLYRLVVVDTGDIICSSPSISTYEDENGNTVQEMDFSFSSILKNK